MCRTNASILAHQPSLAVAGRDESLCSFCLKAGKKHDCCGSFETVNSN